MTKLTFKRHVADWSDCDRCPLHATAVSHVLGRGTLPCDILWIGEAPGPAEDVVGEPFVGPSGQLLDKIVDEVQVNVFDFLKRKQSSKNPLLAQRGISRYSDTFSSYFTNVIACVPWKPNTNNTEFRSPVVSEATACNPRLQEIYELAKPKLVVRLGETAKKYAKFTYASTPVVDCFHPSYLLRSGGMDCLQARRAVLVLTNEILKHLYLYDGVTGKSLLKADRHRV